MYREFGLIGFPLQHSFSKDYFLKKFLKEAIKEVDYSLFPLLDIKNLISLINAHPHLDGLNVTIPYKSTVLPFLDEISPIARQIGAVNVIKIVRTNGSFRLIGFNTDGIGFRNAYQSIIEKHQKALILGTGGAAKAVAYVLKELHCNFTFVSRTPHSHSQFSYNQLNNEIMEQHTLIVNTTPLGMFPHSDECPEIPYSFLSSKHILIDLIYNPAETLFMKKGIEQGAKVINGEKMFQLQAEASWKVWNE